jgi:hypothetical protein
VRREALAILQREQHNLLANPQSGSAPLEQLERLLTALEDKMAAALLQHTPVDVLAELRAGLEGVLAPCRRKLGAAQLAALEPRLLRQRLWEHYHLPRLSLFHLPTDAA